MQESKFTALKLRRDASRDLEKLGGPANYFQYLFGQVFHGFTTPTQFHEVTFVPAQPGHFQICGPGTGYPCGCAHKLLLMERAPVGSSGFVVKGFHGFDNDRVQINAVLTYADETTEVVSRAPIAKDGAGDLYLVMDEVTVPQQDTVQYAKSLKSIEVTDVYPDLANCDDTAKESRFAGYVGAGTLVETIVGHVPVENLRLGHLVNTMDHGPQPLRGVRAQTSNTSHDLRPILIRKDAVGNTRDLLVSSCQKMLLTGWKSRMLFGEAEVLATAHSLINNNSISPAEDNNTAYFSLLFDDPEIISFEGAPGASLQLAARELEAMDWGNQQDIQTLLPECTPDLFAGHRSPPRTSLTAQEAGLITQYLSVGHSPSGCGVKRHYS